jgi:hypothetical protein
MRDQWIDRLSEYLDGDLAPEERTGLEAHLMGCEDCRETLAGLRRILARARALEDRPPGRDLWPGIAERIGARTARPVRVRRRFTFSVPQLLAAGIALAVVSGGSVWMLQPGATPRFATDAPVAVTPAANVAAERGTRSYDAAVADLERILVEGRGRLDSTTVRVLERNLATIDSAIAEARRAVAADSANLYLNSHLAETMRRKLELLRQAARLVATAS